MRNFKLENNLTADINWPTIASVNIEGNKEAVALNKDKTEEYNESVIQSWDKVVVLHAMAPEPSKFFIGFCSNEGIQYLKYEFETDMKFAMRIGPDNFKIFAFPKNFEAKIILEVVEFTHENDEKFKDLILI